MDSLAITVKGDRRLNRIVSALTVRQSQAFSRLEGLESRPVEAMAMWDTGSMVSCISRRLANRLGLTSVDTMALIGLQGSQDADVYMLDFIMPDNTVIANVPVAEIGNPNDFDIIVGMNIISLGDFAISNNKGKTIMSFRLPSADVPIDFSREE